MCRGVLAAAAAPTSIVSNTLTTPGCRSVLNFLSAFFASWRRDRLALMSKEKILHLEPSSCAWEAGKLYCHTGACRRGSTHSLGAIVQGPDGVVHIDTIAEGVGKCWAFGDGRYRRLEEIHGEESRVTVALGRVFSAGIWRVAKDGWA